MTPFDDPQSRCYARLTGVLYLGIAVAGAFAIGFVPSQIEIAGDPAGTLANILARRGLFELGVGADSLVMLAEVMVTVMLFFMFRPVNATLAAATALARAMMVSVMAAMLFFQAGLMMLAETSGDPALAEVLLHMHTAGVWIWQIFFALHLVILGRLVAGSGLYPRLIGLGLSVGGFGYLLDSLYSFAFPATDWLGWLRVGFLVIATIAELGFALWLVIRGPRRAA